MPAINLSFSGYIRNCNIEIAYNAKEDTNVDVSKIPVKLLCKMLNRGELFISLKDHLDEGDCDIEVFDFEPSPTPI